MIRFEEELNQAGVDAEGFSPPSSMASVFASIAKRSLIFLLMLGPALLGTIAHYPAYRLGGYLATRFSRDSEDIISTIKIISAMLLFPLTWLVLAVASYVAFGWLRGWWAAAVVLVTIPLCGYVAIIFFEELDKSIAGIRVLTFFLVRRRFFVRLLAERKAIRNEIVSLGKESPVASE
jgi:ABC-type multidrug transport system fused ATPase/permease subunit